MINKVIIEHFKKFERQTFEIPPHLVVIGPNNSGKTTLLQAIGAWAEIAFQWKENHPDLAREADGDYPTTNLNLTKFHSLPLADFDHLWKDKNVREPASVWLHTDQWKIGFEILYKENELAAIRPAQGVSEDDLEEYVKKPMIPVYIPPLSGVQLNEPLYGSPDVISQRLAQAKPGDVLRNLLVTVSADEEKWKKLQKTVCSFFGYKLDAPSVGAQILVRYRHSDQGQSYDLSSAASGFLQVLMIYAVLLARGAQILLIDEPDAHLHLLLQEKMYRGLYDFSQEMKSQLIIATHSERLINAAADKGMCNLRLLATDNLRKIPNKKKLTDTLKLETVDIVLAQTEAGILYTEGFTDIDILREWARVLAHPLLAFLEKPFRQETAEDKWLAAKHFSAMRSLVPGFRGVELRDGDGKDHEELSALPDGMKRLFWQRYEIESYLLHPESLGRYIKTRVSPRNAEKTKEYMKQQLPPALYEKPFEPFYFLSGAKAKDVLSGIFQEAGLSEKETAFYKIAAQMTKAEIHPEVIEKLDAIATHFNLACERIVMT